MNFFWALLLFSLGVIFLGAEFNLWGYDEVRELWQFWPLILVFAGLDMITKRLRFGWILMLITFILSAAFIYGVIFTEGDLMGVREVYNSNREVTRSEVVIKKDEGVVSQKVNIEMGASNVDISGSSEELISGYLDSTVAEARVVSEIKDDLVSTNISMDSEKKLWFGNLNVKNDLKLAFNKLVPLSIRLGIGASSLNLDLSEYVLRSLEIEGGASSIELRIGNSVEDGAKIAVRTGAADLKMKIPDNVNVVVESESALSNVKSPEKIENAEKTIYLTVKSAATSVEVTR